MNNIEADTSYSCGILARMPETISCYELSNGKLRVERKEGIYLFNEIIPNHWKLDSFEPKPDEGGLERELPLWLRKIRKEQPSKELLDINDLHTVGGFYCFPHDFSVALDAQRQLTALIVRKETTAKIFGDILHLLETKWAYTEFAEIAAGDKEAGLVKKVIAKVIDGVKALKSKEGI